MSMMAVGGETAGGKIRKTRGGVTAINQLKDSEHQGQGGGNMEGEKNIPRKTDKGQKSGWQGGDRNIVNIIKRK